MNSSVYIFGNLLNGYTQYPDDATQSIFSKFSKLAKGETQIITRREGALMHYGYIRKLEEGKYFGLCAQLNGALFTDIKLLFKVFEETFEQIVANENFLRFSETLTIVPCVSSFQDKQNALENLSNDFRKRLEILEESTRSLPPVNFDVAENEAKSFFVDDSNDVIVEAIGKYGYVYIYKNFGINSKGLSNYKGALTRFKNEKDQLADKITLLEKDIVKLKEENTRISRQKKNFSLVAWLMTIATIVGFVVAILMSQQKREILSQYYKISSLNDTINNQKSKIKSLSEDVDKRDVEIMGLNKKISTLNKAL